MRFHPASLLLTWMTLALLLQWIGAFWLLAGALVSLTAALLMARRPLLTMLRRLRWLLLAVTVIFTFITPGVYLEGVGGSLGLTHEGLEAAGEHLLRLLTLVATLVIALSCLPVPRLVTAVHTLLFPLSLLGLPRDRAALRLTLVLRYIEDAEDRTWRSWLMEAGPSSGGEVVPFSPSSPRLPDYLLWLTLAGLLLTLGMAS